MSSSDRVDCQLVLDDGVLFFQWVRSRRRRHFHLVLDDHAGLQVRTPAAATRAQVDALVMEQRAWIAKALARRDDRLAARPPLADGTRLPFLDESLELRLGIGHRRRVSRRGDQLVVNGPAVDDETLRKVLERWYRDAAGRALEERIAPIASRTGLMPAGITIRAQRRRWGSCNSRGHLNLNWRLLLLPGQLADYVLLHELCHLQYMHHGPAFWALVELHMPDYRVRRRAVDAVQGADLVL